jgi:signal transduction histidine kinase
MREDVAQAIENAKADLDKALVQLDRVPAFDPAAVAFVAHAMSNYMHVTDAILGLLREALGDGADPEVLTWLDGLHHVSELTHQTVGRLLRAYDPHEIPLQFEYMRLDVLVERACAYHRRGATQKEIEIICRYPPDLPRVWADRVGVAVVVDNLMSNAVKFSHAGGEIDVEISTAPGGVQCSVTDCGPGLTPLMQAQVFERGNGSAASTKQAKGHPNGYGLTVAKAFVDRMHGRLWSESEPGKGASFTFRLPYQSPERPPSQAS